jgi:hypothetical protein
MLVPSVTNHGSSYNFVSSGDNGISIPSIELQDKFGSMHNVLQSMVQYHLGTLDFEPTYILYDVYFHDNIVNIYYYTFLPFNTEISNGHFISIEEIQHIPSYQKLVQKIFR